MNQLKKIQLKEFDLDTGYDKNVDRRNLMEEPTLVKLNLFVEDRFLIIQFIETNSFLHMENLNIFLTNMRICREVSNVIGDYESKFIKELDKYKDIIYQILRIKSKMMLFNNDFNKFKRDIRSFYLPVMNTFDDHLVNYIYLFTSLNNDIEYIVSKYNEVYFQKDDSDEES